MGHPAHEWDTRPVSDLAEVGVWFELAVLRLVGALLAGLLDARGAAGVLGQAERAVGEDAEYEGGESG